MDYSQSLKGTREVGSAVLVRESNIQLLRYSLDIRVRYSTCLLYTRTCTNFQVSERLHRGWGEFSHNYLIDNLINYTIITS